MPISKIIANWKNNVFYAVYWLEGEEPFYIDQVVEYAEKQLLPEAKQAFNLTIFYGKDADWAEIINACKRYPVFAERQVVILKEAQHMNQLDKLLSYIDAGRINLSSAEADLNDSKIPSTAGVSSSRYIYALYQQRLNEEAMKLQDKFPIRIHYTK